MDTILNLRG